MLKNKCLKRNKKLTFIKYYSYYQFAFSVSFLE